MGQRDFDADVTSVASLGEPLRRALYRYIVTQTEPVSREQAATAVGVAVHAAKFHLDRLEQEGLLVTDQRRPPGRRGPGAGRPAKVYRRSEREIEVSLPERRYDFAGRMMAEAITASALSGAPVEQELSRAAREAGRHLGQAAREAAGPRPRQAALVEAVQGELADQGYEPHASAAGITLVNCPFHSLAEAYTDLVCSMNLDLMSGVVEASGVTRAQARLDPAPGRCCVVIDRS